MVQELDSASDDEEPRSTLKEQLARELQDCKQDQAALEKLGRPIHAQGAEEGERPSSVTRAASGAAQDASRFKAQKLQEYAAARERAAGAGSSAS